MVVPFCHRGTLELCKQFTYAHIWVYAFSGPQGRRELLYAIAFHVKDDGKFSLGKNRRAM